MRSQESLLFNIMKKNHSPQIISLRGIVMSDEKMKLNHDLAHLLSDS